MNRLVAIAIALAISATAVASSKAVKQLSGVVNINTATAAELMLLPGIGKGKADAIIAYRHASPFKTQQDLTKVKGIGQKMLAKIQQYVVVDGPTTAKVIRAQAAPAALVQKTGS